MITMLDFLLPFTKMADILRTKVFWFYQATPTVQIVTPAKSFARTISSHGRKNVTGKYLKTALLIQKVPRVNMKNDRDKNAIYPPN